jgi:hypothetical protein
MRAPSAFARCGVVCVLLLTMTECTRDFDALFAGASSGGGDGGAEAASGGAGTGGMGGTGGISQAGAAGTGALGGTGGQSGASGSGGAAGNDAGCDSSYAAAVLCDQPIAYYRLGESAGTAAKDEKNTFPASYVGQVDLARTGALINDPDTAVHFSAMDSYVLVPDADPLDFAGLQSFTLEVWVEFDLPLGSTGTGRFHLVSKKDDSVAVQDQRGYALFFNGDQDAGSSQRFGFVRNAEDADGGLATKSIVSDVIPSPGVYHHVVAVFTGSSPPVGAPANTLQLFVDGAPSGQTNSSSAALPATSIDLSLGNSPGGGQSANGTLDEVAIYAKALSPERIQAHYAIGANGP